MKKKVLAAMLVCALAIAVFMTLPKNERESWAWNRSDGYKMGESPFTTVTSNSASEQAKAALKAQIDVSDSSYDREKAEREAERLFQLFDKWRHSDYGELIIGSTVGKLYTGQFRSYSMIGSSDTPSQPTTPVTPTPTPQPTTQPTQQPETPTPQPPQTSKYIYFDLDMGSPAEARSVNNCAFMFQVSFAREGYIFLGWFDEDGNQVTAPSADLAGKTLTAHWAEE